MVLQPEFLDDPRCGDGLQASSLLDRPGRCELMLGDQGGGGHQKCPGLRQQGDDDLLDVVRYGGVVLYDLAALTDNSHGHLKAIGYSGEVVAKKEVFVIVEASQGFSHPFQGILLDDSHVAQAVAFAIFDDQVFLHQSLEGVAHGGLVQAELCAQHSGGLWGPWSRLSITLALSEWADGG